MKPKIKEVTATDLARKSKQIFEWSLEDGQVIITQHGKKAFVLIPYRKHSNQELIDSLVGCIPSDTTLEGIKQKRLENL